MSEGISIGAIIFIAVKPKIYLILSVGWLLVKYNLLTMETSRGISNMVVNALLPCLSFNKIVTNLSGSQIKEIGVVVLSALVIFSTGCALATLKIHYTSSAKMGLGINIWWYFCKYFRFIHRLYTKYGDRYSLQ